MVRFSQFIITLLLLIFTSSVSPISAGAEQPKREGSAVIEDEELRTFKDQSGLSFGIPGTPELKVVNTRRGVTRSYFYRDSDFSYEIRIRQPISSKDVTLSLQELLLEMKSKGTLTHSHSAARGTIYFFQKGGRMAMCYLEVRRGVVVGAIVEGKAGMEEPGGNVLGSMIASLR